MADQDARNREKAVFRLALIADLTNHPYRLQCEQAKLCTLLVEKLSQHESATLHFGAKVIGLRQHADHVDVSAKLGDSKECSDFTGRFVVGADGAGSTVRTLLGLEFQGSTYPETTVLVSTPFPFHEHIDGISNVSYCWSPSGNFALLRLKEFWRCSLYYDPDLTFEAATAPERIRAQLREIHASKDPFSIVDARPYRVHQRIVGNYRSGRVLLAGDAAHVNSPSGGMGMNGGIHDAFNLVEKLSRVWRGAGPELLDQYTRQRLPVAKSAILEQSDRNRKRMTQKDPDARARALASLQATAADQSLARDYLIKSSMIDGLQGRELSSDKHCEEDRLMNRVICSGFAVALMAAATQLAAETVTIKVATFVPEKSTGVSKVIKPWMDAVAKDAGSDVKMQAFWGGSLGKSPFKQYELVKNGIADVTWYFLATRLGNFPSYRSWNCRSSQKAVMLLPWRVGNSMRKVY